MEKFKILLLIPFLLSALNFAQNRFNPALKSYGWGQVYYTGNRYKETPRKLILDQYTQKGVMFGDKVFLLSKVKAFDSKRWINNEDISIIIISKSTFPGFELGGGTIENSLQFEHDTVKTDITVNMRGEIKKEFRILNSRINGFDFSDSIKFKNLFSLFNTKVANESRFLYSVFESKVDLRNNTFSNLLSFENCIFEQDATFRNSRFENALYLTNVDFRKSIRFPRVKFNNKVEFARVTFGDTIDFSWAQFSGAVDLRRCSFEKVKAVYLENIVIPDGKLFVDWDQLKSVKGEHKIRLSMASSKDNWDNYRRLVLIYEKLRDNYLAQGKKDDADNVMYELAVYRNELTGNFWTGLYGTFLGYGYRPWQFVLLFVVPLILLIALIYYFFCYGIVARIVSPLFKKQNPPPLESPQKIFKLWFIPIKLCDHEKMLPKIKRLEKFWHVVYFSATVLLSFRFKSDWLIDVPDGTAGKNNFLIFVTFQWLLGILIYVVFSYYVLSSQFGFLKGLLGI